VSADFACRSQGVIKPSLVLLRDFSDKVAKNLWEIRKKIGSMPPRFSGSNVPVKQNIFEV
jgi:hypothetical protein